MQKIDELRGKRVTSDFPAAKLLTTIGFLELQAYGLDPQKDVKLLKAEFTPVAINNLMEKRTDAVLGSLSGSKMAEAESKAGLRVLPFEESKVPFLRQRLPALYATKAPSGMPGVTPGLPVVATANVTFVSKEMDDETAYTIIKVLLDNYKELLPIHNDFGGWTPDRAVRDLGMPYHSGAIRYYKEKGLWSNEMDQRQMKLLSTGK
jgi:uncharacterized protein